MLSETRPSKNPVSRAPDNRFKGDSTPNDVTLLQLDDSFDDDGDPYNNTGRHLLAAIKDRNRD